MEEPMVLYSKDEFVFIKNGKNNYSISFQIQNNNVILPKIIDFNLIKLIYDLNSDIYEKINIQIINDNEAILNLLMKHLFEDLGLPQRFSYVHMKRVVDLDNNNIIFTSKSIKDGRPSDMPSNALLLPVKNMITTCKIITDHIVKFSCNILYDDDMIIPQVAEKLIGIILFKIFKRVKQFIENVRI
jgi:hypothetical protein